jgi:hypothetical protein
MKKLTLQLETLTVESFETAGPEALRGTVHGHGDSSNCSYFSPNYTFCNLSCEFACGESHECTPVCPGTGTTSGTGTTTTTDPTPQTFCNLSCEFACR